MYMYTQGHSRLVSTGVYLPEERLTSREILETIDAPNRFDIPLNWLERIIGVQERRVTPQDESPSDMAARAAREALETANLRPEDVDVIIYAGVVRDYLLEPATAHVVQDKIGASNAVVFDVTNACHGFMNGIHLVDALIATGQARRGLIVTGEQGSRYAFKAMDALRNTTDRETFLKLAGSFTIGDAGAAMILGPKLEPETGFMGFMLQSQGQHSSLCVCGKPGQESLLETEMAQIIEAHIALLANMYDVFMQKLGWQPEDIACFVHHQVGRKVFKHHAKYARISQDIMPDTVSTLGNLITANIPVNLHNLMKNKEVKNGDKVFIAGAGSGLSVSQSGLIWNAA